MASNSQSISIFSSDLVSENKKLIYRDLSLSLEQIKIQYNATRNSKIF
jgi:hypothetical protein